MRRHLHGCIGAALAGLLVLTCARAAAQPVAAQPAASAPTTEVERGRYLARAGDCVSCHTAPNGKPYAGGLPMHTGFGVIYSPNITPDQDTGIGKWSADDFYRALHTGHDDEGKNLYPAFPYPWFTKVTKGDVLAIKAYLDTVEPVRQANRPPELPWWMRWRPLMAGWNLLNFDEGEYKPDPHKSVAWNRGAYLVEGLGHCGDCHTAKGPLGGPHQSRSLQGGALPDGWYAPSLAGDLREGLGDWSEADIVEYLKTGSTARTAPAGAMSEVIAHSTRYLRDSDLQAVATYLKDLPATGRDRAHTPPLGRDRLERGQALFMDHCIGCHMKDGGGLPGVFPTLAGSSAIQAADPGTVVRVVLEGQRIVATPDKPTGIAMPGFGWKLDDRQVADVVSYIRNAWGNRGSRVEPATVAAARKTLEQKTAGR